MINVEDFINENNRILQDIKSEIAEIKQSLKVDDLQVMLEDLRTQSKKENLWNNVEEANKIFAEIKNIENKISGYNEVNKLLSDCNDIIEMIQDSSKESDDDFTNSLIKDLEQSISNLQNKIEQLSISTLFKGKYDNCNAILTLHPGAGGTEAHDWVQMLYRMYCRWAEQNGFTVKELDFLAGDEAGIKSVTFSINGEYAYGYLKSEMGVHRLVRISPFDAGGRRHTSFASLEVIPEIEEDLSVEINPDDLRVDTYRASGAGGQHINKTSSAVRITHIPTGIVVQCQNERSQQMNRETCMKMLTAKLIQLKEANNKDTIDELKGIQMQIAWGSQIRSYVFCPYTMVKDHRTNYEVGNVEGVMNGDLTPFMTAYLKQL